MTDTEDTRWWRQVLAAADRALDLAPGPRALFLEQCAADDAALGAELRALLADAEAPSPLDGAAGEFAAPILDALAHGRQAATPPRSAFGPYRIVRELGRGGMGTVYLAERGDDQYQKQVALKVLSAWSTGDARRVQRFLEERQILAALDHPGIARLVDGGVTPGGQPWFAMEYVDGAPIDRHCDERSLPIEGRLTLFLEICSAVQYAHRNLVVHRDLKPANILVTADGHVRLLDFGIAKLLRDDVGVELTQTADRLLTPMYASPEQIRGGPISTATDVYALGVLLNVLLTGRSPYHLSSPEYHEVVRAVLEQEAVRPSLAIGRPVAPRRGAPSAVATPEQIAQARRSTPSRLRRQLQGDLDAIVLKAVEKIPTQRYGSVEQLDADVRRHLAGLPITARTGGRGYRARKFLRRHRVGAAVAAGVTAVVLGFGTVTAVQSARIRAQAERIAAARDQATQLTSVITRTYQGSALSTSDRGIVAREILDSAAALINGQRFPDPAQRAQLELELGRTYLLFNLPAEARALAESSLARRRRQRPESARDVAESAQFLGHVLLAQNQLGAAERAYADALALRQRGSGARDADVARSLVGLASVWRAQGRLTEAESVAYEAMAIDRAQRKDPSADLAQSTGAVARVLLDKGDRRGAVRLSEEALALTRAKYSEEHVEVAIAVFDLATALKMAGEQAAGDSLLRYGQGLYHRLAAAVILGTPPRPRDFGGAAITRALGASVVDSAVAAGNDDGSLIAFVSDRDGPDPLGTLGTPEIYVMRPDGTGQRRLTFNKVMEGHLAWSPDGRQIAYFSRDGGGSEVFVMNADGTQQHRLTNLTPLGLGAFSPTWAPDGKRIAFQTAIRADIYVVNVDGTGLENITGDRGYDSDPAWSPDGRRIAFTSRRDGNLEVYTMDPDGGHVVRLTRNSADDSSPEWSPDGRRIVFVSNRDGNQEIYVMNADGSRPVRLTTTPNQEDFPDWSPDGRRIVFHRRVGGHIQIHVMNADGSGQRRLTALSPVVYNGFPAWSPAGTYYGKTPPRSEAGSRR